MRLPAVLLGAVLLVALPAWALCDGVSDDTAEIQAMLDTKAKADLPAGQCRVSPPGIVLPPRTVLSGALHRTALIPTAADMTLVAAGPWSTIRDIQIGYDASTPLYAGLVARVPAGQPGYDRVRIDNVVVIGQFTGAAFLCENVASSSIKDSAFYSYATGSYAGMFNPGCSDWTITATEWHAIDQTSPGGGALWFNAADSIRLYGGNVSGNLASGDPLWWLVNVQSSGSIILDGVTFYADWGPFPACGVFVQGPAPHLRGNTMFVGQATC